MTTTVQTETLRACIEYGGRGQFAKELLALYSQTNPKLPDILRVEHIADSNNQAALRAATQQAFAGGISWPLALLNFFPGLALLDEPTDNPHAIRLRGE